MIKFYDYKPSTRHEIRLLQATVDISVKIKEYVRNQKHALIDFVIPCLDLIESSKLKSKKKVRIFRQIHDLILHLHDHHKIIYDDIKLFNIFIDHDIIKLCDFG